MEVRYHPLFERWLVELAEANYCRQHTDASPIVIRGNR